MKKILGLFLFILLGIATFATSPIIHAQEQQSNTMITGVITKEISQGKETFMDQLVPFQELEVKISSGEMKDQTIVIKHSSVAGGMNDVKFQEYSVGDKIKIYSGIDAQGNQIYNIDGKVKKDGLIMLVILFVAVVLIVGRVWGALSLLGLAASFLVIFKMIVPMIIKGVDPVLAAVLGSMIIVPTTFYISHGFNTKTHVGVVSTFIALIITGVLAGYFVDKVHLTGFASEEAGFLQVERSGSVDIRGILLAGIIIGALGILDDITIGQASTIKQLLNLKKDIQPLELFKKGMQVGQDHISSMVNTLILVYAGASLPLLLLFFDSEKSFGEILEFELIAEEIVRMLTGSIGLVLAAPLATALAVVFMTKNQKKTSKAKIKTKSSST